MAVSYPHLDVYKRQEYGYKISISQIEEIGMFGLEDVQEGLVRELRKLVEKEGLKLCLLYTSRCV